MMDESAVKKYLTQVLEVALEHDFEPPLSSHTAGDEFTHPINIMITDVTGQVGLVVLPEERAPRYSFNGEAHPPG